MEDKDREETRRDEHGTRLNLDDDNDYDDRTRPIGLCVRRR